MMPDYPNLALPDNPKLVENLTHFARALRRAGLPVGSGRVLTAIEAVAAAGFTRKTDFYWVLHACFVNRPEHRAVYHQVFRLYWRDPRFLEHMMSLLLPTVRGAHEQAPAAEAARRAAEALLDDAMPEPPRGSQRLDSDVPHEIEIDATRTASADERLKTLDFEQMSAVETAQARRMLARMALPVKPLVTRRLRPSPSGARPDWRRSARAALHHGGELLVVSRRRPALRWPALVVICDISGSMSDYSRMVLHFVHAVANRKGRGWAKVHAFTFGTRLTNITRHLRTRDVDAALNAAGAEAWDWQGGTRIGDCLATFNRDWSRRVLGQGAVVLLITDGLDRDDPADLAVAMERLHLSCRRLIWLNPLLRWDGFVPRARGIRAMLPHVDMLRSAHSIASLEALAAALSDPEDRGEKARLMSLLDA